jgi:hypothetical protein
MEFRCRGVFGVSEDGTEIDFTDDEAVNAVEPIGDGESAAEEFGRDIDLIIMSW